MKFDITSTFPHPFAMKWLHHSNQVYAPTTDAEEAEVDHFYEDLQDFLELTPKKKKKKKSYSS